ncbi:MAG TPA: hypothetical protein VM638_05285 [Actinomycetota bacterium]|nr:hypothetical protein [Actinomycetota bacterium]
MRTDRAWLPALGWALAGLIFSVGLTLAAYALVGGGAAQPALPVLGDLPTPTASPSGSPSATPTTGVDVSGPCDEPEHRNDPRCLDGGSRSGSNRGPGSGDD